MPVALATPPNGPLYRVARPPDPLAWPDRRFIGGSRFDDPHDQFRVLYLAEQRRGCFVEILAGFRPDLQLLARLQRVRGASGSVPPAVVPADWYSRRVVGQLRLEGGQRWLDLREPETLQALRAELVDSLVALGLPDFDVSAARGPSRELTRQIPDGRSSTASRVSHTGAASPMISTAGPYSRARVSPRLRRPSRSPGMMLIWLPLPRSSHW